MLDRQTRDVLLSTTRANGLQPGEPTSQGLSWQTERQTKMISIFEKSVHNVVCQQGGFSLSHLPLLAPVGSPLYRGFSFSDYQPAELITPNKLLSSSTFRTSEYVVFAVVTCLVTSLVSSVKYFVFHYCERWIKTNLAERDYAAKGSIAVQSPQIRVESGN